MTADKPKKHSPFTQVIFRKSGEAADLAGKALIGFSGVGSLLQVQKTAHMDWFGLIFRAAVGVAFLALGIYLQAKAEET